MCHSVTVSCPTSRFDLRNEKIGSSLLDSAVHIPFFFFLYPFPTRQFLPMLFHSTNFTEKNYVLYLFSGNYPIQRTLKHPFSKKMDSVYIALLSLAYKFDLAVCFCSIIVKIAMYWTGTGTLGKYCPSTAAACELP